MPLKRSRKQSSAGDLLSRRGFLKRTSSVAAGALAFPYIVPGAALGLNGNVAPSERTVMGCIGMGGMGCSNLNSFLSFKEVEVVAVCDVDRSHCEGAQKIVNDRNGDQACVGYSDFREILARDDLDAVSIAVPDHWHSIPAILAAQRGLDIYAEKPLSLTLVEGRAMCDAVDRYDIVWQTGSWQRSQQHFRRGCELVRNGRIGTVKTVKVGLPTGSPCPAQPAMPVPDGFDYDMWLGPAPWAPYTEKRCHWNFRWILDYSGGQLTDWAAHHCDIANWGMGTEYTGPVRVEGQGDFPRDGLWNAATDYSLECQFAPGASPVAPDGFTMQVSNKFPMGARFEGTEGWVYVDRSGLWTEPASLKNARTSPDGVRLYESNNHHGNFLECRRTRAKTITPIEVAHRAISIAHLGNIAMQVGRPIHWDPVTERIIDDSEADRKRQRTMRGPWTLNI